MPTTLTPTTTPAPLTAGDRCDRCGAQAKVRAIMPGGGDLLFCGHHAKEYDERLRAVAVQIVDDTTRVDREATSAREF